MKATWAQKWNLEHILQLHIGENSVFSFSRGRLVLPIIIITYNRLAKLVWREKKKKSRINNYPHKLYYHISDRKSQELL